MKVVVDFRLARFGGSGTYARTLVEGLALTEGIELSLIGPRAYQHSEVPDAARKCTYVACEVPPFSIREQVSIPRLVGALGADVLHIPYYNFPLRAPLPVVVSIHDLVWFHREHVRMWRPAVQYSRFMIRQAMSCARAIITGSLTARAEIMSRFPTSQIPVSVTPHAVSPSVRSALARATNVRREENLLLYVGTFRPSKRVDVLVRAVAELRKRGRPVRLILAGTPARHSNQNVAALVNQLGLDDLVTITGPVSDDELAILYRRAMVYVMPSEYEGFGLTTIEAMAAECPILAADVPIHREVAGSAAGYFAPSNVMDLADRVTNLGMATDLRREMGLDGVQRARGHTLERLVGATITVYERACSGFNS